MEIDLNADDSGVLVVVPFAFTKKPVEVDSITNAFRLLSLAAVAEVI